jgi:hypothetical protein
MGLTHFNATLPAGVLPEDDAQALVGFMHLLFHPALPHSFYVQVRARQRGEGCHRLRCAPVQMYVVAGITITFVLAARESVVDMLRCSTDRIGSHHRDPPLHQAERLAGAVLPHVGGHLHHPECRHEPVQLHLHLHGRVQRLCLRHRPGEQRWASKA